MEDFYQDPDEILYQINKEDSENKKGKLKIFFGMCAGVGKTYSMLKSAHEDKEDGKDIIIGYIETHGRKETEYLTNGLETIPRKIISYKDKDFQEMDLDKIIQRKPEIVLVDELAHTNIPGSRHNKRYQDVIELINNGINVYTTLNIQHLESRSDIVSQITGIIIHEKVPDFVFDIANEIEVIDISSEELIKRLNDGKVYIASKSKLAVDNFFKNENINALREMSLRLTAERVDQQLREYIHIKKIAGTWKYRNLLMVALGSSPYSTDLLRFARRISYTMESKWIAVYIDTGNIISDLDKDRLNNNIKLAQELGAEVITTSGNDIVEALLRIARREKVTHIVLGKPRNNFHLFGNSKIVNRLIKESGDIDIYVIGGDISKKNNKKKIFNSKTNFNKQDYLLSSIIISIVILICFFIQDFIGYKSISLILVLTLSFLPLFFEFSSILLASFLGALLWDLLFIPPKFTFIINSLEDLLMFILFFTISTVNGILNTRLRSQEKIAHIKEEKSTALYNLIKDLSSTKGLSEIINLSIHNIKKTFSKEISEIIIIPSIDGSKLEYNYLKKDLDEKEISIIDWVFKNNQKAGKYTSTLPSLNYQYHNLYNGHFNAGVLGINFYDKVINHEQEILLSNFIYQISSSIEREYLNSMAREALILSESEKLYESIFNSISHEIRTPISAIMSASSSLISNKNDINNQLCIEIFTASKRLNRIVGNLLDMSRLQSGKINLNLNWYDINDLINDLIKDINLDIRNHKIIKDIPEELILVKVDFVLLKQAITNIVINSIHHTQDDSIIKIQVKKVKKLLFIIISDNGPGIPEEFIKDIFNEFYRFDNKKSGGIGLGLSIAKGFIEAHSGTLEVSNCKSGGLEFIIKLNIENYNLE